MVSKRSWRRRSRCCFLVSGSFSFHCRKIDQQMLKMMKRLEEGMKILEDAPKKSTYGKPISINALKNCFPTIIINSCITSSTMHPAGSHCSNLCPCIAPIPGTPRKLKFAYRENNICYSYRPLKKAM